MNDIEQLERKESNRYRLLKFYYENSGSGEFLLGLYRTDVISFFVGENIMSQEEIESAYYYLKSENLISEYTSGDYTNTITHCGTKEIEASIRYPDESTSHFSTQAIQFIINQVVIKKMTMGDNFERISDSTIVNRSFLENAFNKVKTEYDEETANALKSIEEEINESGNREAAENFDSFSEELSKPQPKKSLLKTLWKGTLEALPRLAQLTSIVSNIEKLL
jgi:hypothetical protein